MVILVSAEQVAIPTPHTSPTPKQAPTLDGLDGRACHMPKAPFKCLVPGWTDLLSDQV